MSISANNSNLANKIQARMNLLKSGFKKYVVATKKVPINTENKWTLEVVALDNDYPIPENFMQNSALYINEKGKLYNLQTVTTFIKTLEQNKSEWMKIMRE